MPVEMINQYGVELPLALWVMHDDYDYQSDPDYYSATTLLRPVQQTALLKLNADKMRSLDIISLVKAQIGSSIHAHNEAAWKDPKTLRKVIKLLGMREDFVDRLVINPKLVKDTQIPVYIEVRTIRDIKGKKVGGKFDLVLDGEVNDTKSTGTFSYGKADKQEDYVLQGSIYRWLNPEIITKDTVAINFIFTDWNEYKATTSNGVYPSSPLLTERYALLSLEETEQFILDKIARIEKAVQTKKMPECTDKELWADPPVWKYYKKAGAARATKNYDNKAEAMKRKAKEGGIVVETPSKAKACNYCSSMPFCQQAVRLTEEGRL